MLILYSPCSFHRKRWIQTYGGQIDNIKEKELKKNQATLRIVTGKNYNHAELMFFFIPIKVNYSRHDRTVVLERLRHIFFFT